MDVRGVEVTNQLRSAIRAKLLELGVRCDEELPDYILVMVVTKKSRQQMQQDLHLFLEDSTTPFVDWLHDQVLKKLEKVTIAKKKSTRELSITVKQEEDKKKRRIATSFLEDQIKVPKDEKDEKDVLEKLPENPVEEEEEENSQVYETEESPEDNMVMSNPEEPEEKEEEPVEKSGRLTEEENEESETEEELLGRLKSSISRPRSTSSVVLKPASPRKRICEEPRFKSSNRRRPDRRDLRNVYSSRDSDYRRNRNLGDVRSRLGRAANDKKPQELNVKDRLGSHASKLQKEADNSKSRSIKNRLGPMRGNFRQTAEDEDDDEEEEVTTGLRSRVIAVKNPAVEEASAEEGDEGEDKVKVVPSKVIVTPRPLKPLQPVQKRATQSLLLRAVAEANQSVVMHKNPEPSLAEKVAIRQRLLPNTESCQAGNNLSVHFDEQSRLVMEKIQIELTTQNAAQDGQSQAKQKVADEHMDVVMSLFQRGDDNQNFVVTLNGYDNSVDNGTVFEEGEGEEEDGLEVEVNEEDELTLSNSQEIFLENEASQEEQNEESHSLVSFEKKSEDNNENQNIENVEEKVCRKRKLSPIVYNRSPSPALKLAKSRLQTTPKVNRAVESGVFIMKGKSTEKCRYWPNCSLGIKCAFHHPEILCSVFPACKYGDKCVYKHPKCKFGIGCTKLGCVFAHPSQQCKYHPFCTKSGCPYTHPPPVPSHPIAISNTNTVDLTQQRAKFTWTRTN